MLASSTGSGGDFEGAAAALHEHLQALLHLRKARVAGLPWALLTHLGYRSAGTGLESFLEELLMGVWGANIALRNAPFEFHPLQLRASGRPDVRAGVSSGVAGGRRPLF